MRTIADILSKHAFFEDLSPEDLAFIAGCGKNVVFREGDLIAKPGDPANEFYLIREGHVSLILETPTQKPFVFQTVGPDEILGHSWLIEPYIWTISAKAILQTRAVSFDGKCIREKCEKEPRLGFLLMKHLTAILAKREEAAMLHLLDVYGK